MNFLKYILSAILISFLHLLPISFLIHKTIYNSILNISLLEDNNFINLSTLIIAVTILLLNIPKTKKEWLTILKLSTSILPFILINFFFNNLSTTITIYILEIILNIILLLYSKKNSKIKKITLKNYISIPLLLLSTKITNVSLLLILYLLLKKYYSKEELLRYIFILYSIILCTNIKTLSWNYYYFPSLIILPLFTSYFYQKYKNLLPNKKYKKLIILELILSLFTLFWFR